MLMSYQHLTLQEILSSRISGKKVSQRSNNFGEGGRTKGKEGEGVRKNIYILNKTSGGKMLKQRRRNSSKWRS